MQKCNRHILEAQKLARELIILSDEGESEAEDDRCLLLYSVIRDCAYKIQDLARREEEAHSGRNN